MWRPSGPHPIAWREWDDELVVYNGATGNTHQLSALGGRVLRMLLQYPSGIETSTLVRELARHIEVPEDVSLAAEIERVLEQLGELRLASYDSP